LPFVNFIEISDYMDTKLGLLSGLMNSTHAVRAPQKSFTVNPPLLVSRRPIRDTSVRFLLQTTSYTFMWILLILLEINCVFKTPHELRKKPVMLSVN
jgi:hypothetical protein